MKAVILVGGHGTRLLPLTINTPKPLIPLVNRPFLDHMLFLLREHGITDVVLALAYLSESFEGKYGDGSHLGMKLTYAREEKPMGTGGAIKNVEGYLNPGEAFLVLNGDILTDLDLTDMLRFHRESASICTLSLTPVEDPSAYGVVDLDDTGRISRFTEKPKREEATSNWISAGTYVLESEVMSHLPIGEFHMVERGLFPDMLAEGKPLYGYRSDRYWIDIGTPAKYLQAHYDLLSAGRLKYALQPEGDTVGESVWAGKGTSIHKGARVTGPVLLGSGCTVDEGASITGPAVLGDGCRVLAEAALDGVVAWNGATFEARSRCSNSIVGNNARIAPDAIVERTAVIGDGASVGQGNYLSNGLKLWPGVNLPDKAITF
jgi:mannose-1-phosphate guanylyltransferase